MEVREAVSWVDMMALVASSQNVLVPDDWRGGGERAVLEARACGVTVLVAEDNPKLQSLREGPLYTTLYYAGQLELGLLRSRQLCFSIERRQGAASPPSVGMETAAF